MAAASPGDVGSAAVLMKDPDHFYNIDPVGQQIKKAYEN
jgi:hypothetical protein